MIHHFCYQNNRIWGFEIIPIAYSYQGFSSIEGNRVLILSAIQDYTGGTYNGKGIYYNTSNESRTVIRQNIIRMMNVPEVSPQAAHDAINLMQNGIILESMLWI